MQVTLKNEFIIDQPIDKVWEFLSDPYKVAPCLPGAEILEAVDEKTYRGDAYACFSWAAYVAEVEVDLRTCAVRVIDFVALQEVGKVLNQTLARGQIQGGVAQGIGWALYENVLLENGAMKNCQMTNYIIPGSGDLPPIRVYFEEQPTPHGPGGAKGIGELPIDGPAPAVINAVCDALGMSIRSIPLTPERLLDLLGSDAGG